MTERPPLTQAQEYAASDAISAVADELFSAMRRYAPMHSAHEGYAVIAEELDELWDAVRMRQSGLIEARRTGPNPQRPWVYVPREGGA